MDCDVPEIAYYEYYDYQQSEGVKFTSASGKNYECVYYVYTPKDIEADENTQVIVWVTHGGGVADEERAIALNHAASWGTEAIFVIPWSDRPEAVCACIEDAKEKLEGKGNFDALSGQGTSSGGRAIIRAALESVDPEEDYSFRFKNVIAYDPVQESYTTNITGNTEGLKALAEQDTVIFFQTDTDHGGHSGGSGSFCNDYARVYSELGGTSIVAEIFSGSHEKKFIKPLQHNSIAWAGGLGELIEDECYGNYWFYYHDGEKIPSKLETATLLLHTD